MLARRVVAVAMLSCASVAGAQAPEVDATGRPQPASAPGPTTGGGWDGDWALLFGLNNILVVGNFLADFDGPAGGTVGGAWHLRPDLGLRGTVHLSRATTDAVVTEQVTQIGDERIVTQTHSRPSPTSVTQLSIAADLIKRLSLSAVAPYAGAGLFVGWVDSATHWRDEVTAPDVVTEADGSRSTFTVGAQGLVGAEWRVHPSFALFAEYGLVFDVYSRTAQRDRTIDEGVADGSRAVTSVSSTRQEWLNLSTGLSWGGQLGLAVHFQ